MAEMLVLADSMSDKKSTVAYVHVHVGGKVYDGYGSSRRMKGDLYNENTGDLIAYTRALEKVLMQMKDDVKKHAREA